MKILVLEHSQNKKFIRLIPDVWFTETTILAVWFSEIAIFDFPYFGYVISFFFKFLICRCDFRKLTFLNFFSFGCDFLYYETFLWCDSANDKNFQYMDLELQFIYVWFPKTIIFKCRRMWKKNWISKLLEKLTKNLCF